MKQQVIIFVSIIAILTAIFSVIFFTAKGNSSEAPKPSEVPLLDMQKDPFATISAAGQLPQQQANATNNVGQGAVELEASSSANLDAARIVEVHLTNGKTFTLALYEDLAPIAVNQFLSNVSENLYNNLLFFRVEKSQGKTVLIQGGDPTNTGTGGGTMRAEYNKKPFRAGSVGIARGQNRDLNSASQFFIATQELAQLNEEYTNFGDVIEGIDVVASIKEGQPIKGMKIIQ